RKEIQHGLPLRTDAIPGYDVPGERRLRGGVEDRNQYSGGGYGFGEIASAFQRRGHGVCVVSYGGIEQLVVGEEEEQLLPCLVEPRAGDDQRAADGAAEILITVTGPGHVGEVIEILIGVQTLVRSE